MRTIPRIVLAAVLALSLTITAVAHGNSYRFPFHGRHGGHHRGHGQGGHGSDDRGTIRALTTIPPDSLDPQAYYSGEAAEADWAVYTPLLTYQHAEGSAGGTLIPGLATALPTVSPDGKTYQLTLRKGMTYSDGEPVKASDFAYTVQRAIKLESGVKGFVMPYLEGAEAFDTGKSKSISGIVTDDKTGKITIKLTHAYGAFANLLGLPNLGLVPSGTPMTNLAQDPPPGVGPYMVTAVDDEGGYTLKQNPRFACLHIAGIPTGYANKVHVRIAADEEAEAEAVLHNEADVFDAAEIVPTAMVPQVEAEAAGRYSLIPSASTYYFFLNSTRAPFNDVKARQAVNTALDRGKLRELSGNTIAPDCFFLPKGIVGHPSTPCPFGSTPDIAKAKQLVQESGTAGTPVEIWIQEEGPRRSYGDYYTQMLNEIGFKAIEHTVPNGEYWETVNEKSNDPQTGFAAWFQDFPNPSDFYFLLDGRTMQPGNSNFNLSQVNDPFVQEKLIPLSEVPASILNSSTAGWEALETYVSNQAYVAPFGSQGVPKFFSNRIDYSRAVTHVGFGNDFTSLRLK